MKPKVFIGCSTENLKIAYAIQENLEHDALCSVWTQGIFNLNESTIQSLLTSSQDFDYAIFVFAPDDISIIREEEVETVRDNVIFELGLFTGILGKDRVFFVVPKGEEKLHLPTDLLGMQPGHYEVPGDPKDILAALGPFCNKIRRIISVVGTASERVQITEADSNGTTISKAGFEEAGIEIDEFGNKTIGVGSTVFFANRIASAFPGVRGLSWFENPKEAIERLEILLRAPLRFQEADGYDVVTDPVWWWRGHQSLHIRKFERLTQSRCLLNVKELEIDKIAVYHSTSYFRHFVYVETRPDQQVGVYDLQKEDIETMISNHGFAFEEYGLFDGIPITRSCYDDGAAEINGKVVDTSGSELRQRYLSKYNFIISSKFSPLNSTECDEFTQNTLNKLLKGLARLHDIAEFVESLPKHRLGGS